MNIIRISLSLFLINSLDIWDSNPLNPSNIRSSVVGLSAIGGICSNNQYSIIEHAGLNSIQNAAHELGHK